MKTSNRTYNQKQQDATGTQEFDYGNMGEVIENRHTYVVPYNSEPITLKTIWYYDSWNRVREIIYPDGEKVSYHYNKGGLLKSMEGDKNGYTTQYIRDIQYDHYDQRVFMEYGNGVTYGYNYNPETRRLDNLYSESTQQGITLQKNEYKYDNVGNILQIKGYGTDPFEHNYNYDASYRLENANGNGTWQGNNLTYEQSFAYSPSGRIDNKNTTSQKLSNQFGLYNEDYDNTYTYDVNDNPYAVRHITDNTNGLDYDFSWDKKGNMIYASNTKRTLCWTEDNRLQAVKDNNMGVFYGYDASGERGLKLTGPTIQVNINGYNYQVSALKEQTLYANPLITINDKGYTKHYFEEGKRICSKIGSGELRDINNLVGHMEMNYEDQLTTQYEGIKDGNRGCIGGGWFDLENNNLYKSIIQPYENPMNPEEPIFYYHSDHLGSASFLTDRDGKETQQLVYLPFGEDWVDMKYNTGQYDTPYKFNGKEKDEETGYNNYGARYYYDWASIWLSVDPMSDERPYLTSYNYCQNNPIMLIDPDGNLDGWVNDPANPDKGTYYDKDINSPEEAESKGVEYKGQTVTVIDQEGNVRYGDEKGNIHKSKPLPEVEIVGTIDKNNTSDNFFKGGMTVALIISQVDSPIPGPADAVAAVVATGVTSIYATMKLWELGSNIYSSYSEHTKNKSKSKSDKHTAKRAGGDPENGSYGKQRNNNRGNKNKKYIPKVNPNKRK